jgi:hypothetical protein
MQGSLLITALVPLMRHYDDRARGQGVTARVTGAVRSVAASFLAAKSILPGVSMDPR